MTLAHQGGWDEILLVLLPIAIFAWLLSVANRRANRQLGAQGRDDAGTDVAAGERDEPPAGP